MSRAFRRASEAAICIPYVPSPQREPLLAYVLSHYYEHTELSIYVTGDGADPGPTLNLSRARNRAAAAAMDEGATTLFFADADTWVPVAQLDEAVRLAGETGGLAIAYEGYVRLSPVASAKVLKGSQPPGYLAGLQNHVSGALAVTVDAFRQVGGFDERFTSWGGEDRAFWAACRTLVGCHRVPGRAFHLWHPPQPSRSKAWPGFQDIVDLGLRYREASGWLSPAGMLPALGREDREPDRDGMVALLSEEGGPLWRDA